MHGLCRKYIFTESIAVKVVRHLLLNGNKVVGSDPTQWPTGAKTFTGLLFYAYVAIHQVRILVYGFLQLPNVSTAHTGGIQSVWLWLLYALYIKQANIVMQFFCKCQAIFRNVCAWSIRKFNLPCVMVYHWFLWQAYEDWIKEHGPEKPLPALGLSHKQLFFVGFAQVRLIYL